MCCAAKTLGLKRSAVEASPAISTIPTTTMAIAIASSTKFKREKANSRFINVFSSYGYGVKRVAENQKRCGLWFKRAYFTEIRGKSTKIAKTTACIVAFYLFFYI